MKLLLLYGQKLFAEKDLLLNFILILQEKFRAAGIECQLLFLPQLKPGREFHSYLASYFLNLRKEKEVDLLLTFNAPLFAVRQKSHLHWFFQRQENYYRQWKEYRNSLSFFNGIKGRFLKFLVNNFDNYFLQRNVQQVFVPLNGWQKILKAENGVDAELLLIPAFRNLQIEFDPDGAILLEDIMGNEIEKAFQLIAGQRLKRQLVLICQRDKKADYLKRSKELCFDLEICDSFVFCSHSECPETKIISSPALITFFIFRPFFQF